VENGSLKSTESGFGNVVNIVLGAVIIGLFVFGGYIYRTKNIVPKGDKKTFDELPVNIQEKYIPKSDMLSLQEQLQDAKEQIKQLKKKLDQKQDMTSSLTPTDKKMDTKQAIKERVIEKIVKVSDSIDKTNYKTYTCKTFDPAGISIPKACKKSLFTFLDTNKNAKLFEIIGLVDDKEFRLIKNLEDVYGVKKIKNIKKYVQRGLSRQRVIEMTWLIKEHFHNLGDEYFKLNAVNYTLYSKNKRGFVIKAYF
jgi:hypothetical protein